MKIAMLMDDPLRESLFSSKTMEDLGQLGEIALNRAGGTDMETVRQVILGCDVAITSWGSPQLDARVLNCAPDLRLVAHAAGSVKGIVSDELFRRNIRVISSARVLSRGVSETALGLTICACKNVFAFHDAIHAGGWVTDYSAISEMYGLTIGVVGCGFAGAHYITLLRAFGVELLAYDPLLSGGQIEALGARKVDLDTLLQSSDVVSLHAPSIDKTYHMIDEKALALMKDNAILINTARGSLIDEAALVKAMERGKLKYACLDMTDPEPPAVDSPLRRISNCIMTPHLAGLANNGKRKIGTHVTEEIARFIQGEPLQTEVTQDMLATIA